MKHLLRLKPCIFLFLFISIHTVASAQQASQINYQGVARKADGSPVSDKAIALRLSIHDGGATSPVVYSETRMLTTNRFGLFTTVIGSPGSSTQSGSMTAIAWSTGNKFLQVELDPEGGSNFQNLGTSQLQSVPFAIFANQALPAGNASGDLSGTYPGPAVSKIQGSPVSATAPQSGQVLRWNGTSWAPADVSGPAGSPVSITAGAPLNASTSGTSTSISLDRASAGADGYLGRTDWLVFNDKTSKEYVDNSINGVKTYADAAIAASVTADATPSIKGKIQLAGDLGGTAAAPVIADGKISSAKILDGAVTNAKIASGISASKVGLGNVDNTTDAAKPISILTQAALDQKGSASDLALKAPLASPAFTGTVSGITKTMVGLGNADNTADAAKPISVLTQAALDQKGSASDLALKAPLASPAFTGTVSGITKTMVGLGDADNTSDAGKPVSAAAQAALDLRELLGNKSVNITSDAASDTKYPSVRSVKTYVDAAATPDADGTTKGKIQLAGDLAGTAALPVISAGAVTDAKIASGAAIADTKLATISTAGKVANTATTAASANTVDAIVVRDASGNFSAGTITAALTGTASFATNIAGGTAGLIPYQSAANTTALLAAGTAGYVLQANGAAAPSWVPAAGAVREIADEAGATAAQTSFTLTQTPSANSKLKMYVNGIRVSNTAYSWTGATLTYIPANNGGYALTAGDRVQIDYYY